MGQIKGIVASSQLFLRQFEDHAGIFIPASRFDLYQIEQRRFCAEHFYPWHDNLEVDEISMGRGHDFRVGEIYEIYDQTESTYLKIDGINLVFCQHTYRWLLWGHTIEPIELETWLEPGCYERYLTEITLHKGTISRVKTQLVGELDLT